MFPSEAQQPDNDFAPPRVSQELLEYLDRVYRHDAWKAARTYDEVARLQGAHEVITKLKHLFSIQIGQHDVLLDTGTGSPDPGASSGDPTAGSA